MRFLLLEPQGYPEAARTILDSLGQVDVGPLDRRGLLDVIDAYEVLIVRLAHRIDREVITRANRLQAIASATTGLDHLDLKAASERQIAILSLQGEREFLDTVSATAEHTWGLLLALVRRIPAAHVSAVTGHWSRDQFKGRELKGRTLGVVGYGRLGRLVARYGLAFGMRVLAHDPYVRDTEQGVEWVPWDRLLELSDFVTLHLPLNEATRRRLGRAEFTRMRQGAWLINTARGGIIDEAALLEALVNGGLGGAALDVLSGEPDLNDPSTQALLGYARTHDNLIVTPHLGGATLESMERAELFMAEKLRGWAFDHRPIRSRV